MAEIGGTSVIIFGQDWQILTEIGKYHMISTEMIQF